MLRLKDDNSSFVSYNYFNVYTFKSKVAHSVCTFKYFQVLIANLKGLLKEDIEVPQTAEESRHLM